MKSLTLLILTALAAAPLMGQDAREIADNLTLPALAPGAKKLPLPSVPEGATITFGGADYEQIIREDGSIMPVIADVPVQVFFKVTKGNETVESKDYEVVVKPEKKASDDGNEKPVTIPAILQWRGGKGEWKPAKSVKVFNDNAIEDASAFIGELRLLLKGDSEVKQVKKKEHADIVLELAPTPAADGADSYRMQVSPKGVTITGDSKAGAYMGTRTLLQILVNRSNVPCGEAYDIPRYKVRGCMLDIARTPFALQDLRDLVNLMAWYKMNDLHLCINNNYIFHENYVDAGRDPFKESYAAFRLESKMKGKDGTRLTAQDLFYTKKDFRKFIDYARARGVNVVPEFDTPGHALSFTRVRPDLIYQGPMSRVKRRCEMLDAANPETLKFVGKVFDEYLLKDPKIGRPVFEGCVVHVGSDEFFGAAEDYRKYTNGVLTHVLNRGYTPRVWGSLSAKPGKTPVVAKGVQMNIWSKDWMLPREAVDQGYHVINTFDSALYIVPFANYYRMDRALQDRYNNWLPNKMGKQQLPAGHPQLLGATFAVWNDLCDIRHRGYGMADIWDTLAGPMHVLTGRLWGNQTRHTPFKQHCELAARLGHGPIFNRPWPYEPGISPTELPATLHGAALRPPYRVTMENVMLTKAPRGKEQVLLSGPEGVLLGVMKDGSIGFRRADGIEFAWDAKLPVGKAVKLELIGRLGKTRLFIDGKEVEKMTLNSFNSLDEGFAKRTRDIISTFILPLGTLGAAADGSSPFRGTIGNITLKPNDNS